MGFRPQVFMAVFMVYSFVALGARRYATAGAAAIASFLCWQPALVVFASSCVAIALERSSRRALARYVAGGLVVCLLYETYFWYHGALREQLFQSYVLPSNLAGYAYKPLWDGVQFILRDGVWNIGWWVFVPRVYLATLAVVVLEPLVRWRAVWARLRGDALPGALSAVAVSSFAFTLIDHQSFPDRYFLQPFIALANGLAWGLPFAWLCDLVVGADQRGRGARAFPRRVCRCHLPDSHPSADRVFRGAARHACETARARESHGGVAASVRAGLGHRVPTPARPAQNCELRLDRLSSSIRRSATT